MAIELVYEDVALLTPLAVKRLRPTAILPAYATQGSACFDMHADLGHAENSNVLYRGDSLIVPSGLAFAVPAGHVMLIFGRSGQAFKHGVRLANSVAVIDPDYRGEVMIKLVREYSNSGEPLTVKHGDRIAQAMLLPIPTIAMFEVEELPETERGTSGLGSTGQSSLG